MGFGRGMGGGGGGRGGRHGGAGKMGGINRDGKDPDAPPPLKITDRRMLRWFARTIGPRWPVILIALIAMIASAGIDTVQPLLLRYLIDQGFGLRWVEAITWAMLMMLLCYFGGSLFNALRMNLMHVLGQRLVYETRIETYAHLQKLSLSYFHRNKTGDLMSRLSNDVNAVEDMVVHGTDEVISDGLRVIFSVGAMLIYLNVKLTLLAMAPLPIFVAAILIFSKYVRPIYRWIRDELGEINAQLEERLAGILVIKAFGREQYEFGNFEEASRRYYDASVKGIRMWSTFFPALQFLTSTGLLLVMWRGGLMLSAGEAVTIGTIMAFVGYLQQFYWRFGSLIRVYDLYNRALAALSRIFQVFEEVPEIEDKPDAIVLEDVKGQVDLEHVTFRYQTGDIVLKDITVHADPGETIALVGRSGAGKTSLVNLIPRFYDPLEGRVLVDGADVKDVTQESLRRQIAMVLQETFLFNGSVKENVSYGKLDASDEEIEAACVAAYADEFIQSLPEKYDTQIGERGVKLSGGQKQRIAIARALLADPRILILDEATSLVDTEAEQMIQKALENLMKSRTTFVIAHRLSTVRKASKIVVIDEGAVVEEADHDTLMQRQGLYAEMYERQFRIAEDWGMQGGEGMMGQPGS
jgi:ABC-type multidrug transport system fused ATPase/permease subunit